MALITSNFAVDFIICTVIGVIGLYTYLTRNYNHWKKYGVKQETPKFPFGNVSECLLAKETPDQLFTRLYNWASKEKMTGFYVFDRPFLLLRDVELIKQILIKDFNNFSNRLVQSGATDDLMDVMNLFFIRNPPWKYVRSKLTPAFTSGKLKKMINVMMEIINDFEVYLDSFDISDEIAKSIEVKEVCGKFTTDLIGITAFGTRLNSLTNPNAEFRKYGNVLFGSSYIRYVTMLSIFLIPQLRPIMKPAFLAPECSNFFKRTLYSVINERMKHGIKRDDVVDLLIDIKRTQDNDHSDQYKLEGDALVAQAAVFFTGGFESSSNTASWALYELAKNPDLQAKARNEILTGLESTNGRITYELVTTGTPYLSMVVDEILRMYPILAFIDRLPDNDYTIPGTDVTVKKGTPIIVPMRALHMDPNFFPDPDKFDPERFSDENKPNITPCSYLPFGEGPRNCLGSRLGVIQTKLCLIKIMSKYELSPCKETAIPAKVDNLNVFVRPPGGIHLGFRKHNEKI